MLVLTVRLWGLEKKKVAFNETFSPNITLNKNPREGRGKGEFQHYSVPFFFFLH